MLYVLFIYDDEGCEVLDFFGLSDLMYIKSIKEDAGYFCSWQMMKLAA